MKKQGSFPIKSFKYPLKSFKGSFIGLFKGILKEKSSSNIPIKSFKTPLMVFGFLAIFIVSAFFLLKTPTLAAWFNDSWGFRKAIPVTNNTTTETNVYIIASVNIADATKAQADDGDFRFTLAGGQTLSYFISAGVGGTAPTFHIQIPSFTAGAQTLYAYYGNPSAQNGFQAADFSTVASNYTVGSLGTEEKSPGPVAYWKFDEGYGTTTNNSGSQGASFNGTLGVGSSAPTWTTEDLCISGKCLKFDGNDYISVGSTIPTVNSVSFWIKPATTTASMINLTSTAYITASSGTITATGFTSPSYYVNGLLTSTPTLTANSWNHIVVTSATSITANAVTIGKANGAYTTGFIDDVKFYAYQRTLAQVKLDYNAGKNSGGTVKGTSAGLGAPPGAGGMLSNGLVGYWKMDETSWSGAANEVVDSSGNANHGTAACTGTGCTIPSTAAAKFGNGGNFTSVSPIKQGVTISHQMVIDRSDFTYSLWAKATNTGDTTQSMLEQSEPSSNNCYSLLYNDASHNLSLANNAGSPASILNYVYNLNNWTHIVVTQKYDQNKTALYINGAQVKTDIATYCPQTPIAQFMIGRNPWTSADSYNGSLDEVRIYNRALSANEVSQLYNFAPPPKIQLKMDEGTGTAANDTSGNSNTGTLNDGALWNTGKYGRGIKLDGANDDVSVGDFGY